MKLPTVTLCWMVEKHRENGSRYMIGQFGTATLYAEPDGETRAGEPRWRLHIQDPTEKQIERRNNFGAARSRFARRRGEGVETVGGCD